MITLSPIWERALLAALPCTGSCSGFPIASGVSHLAGRRPGGRVPRACCRPASKPTAQPPSGKCRTSAAAWALFRTSTIAARLQHQLDLQTTLAGVQLTARGPHDAGERPGEFLSVPVGRALPEWRLRCAGRRRSFRRVNARSKPVLFLDRDAHDRRDELAGRGDRRRGAETIPARPLEKRSRGHGVA